MRERTDREVKRRAKVVQVLSSVKSLERLAGVVMCDQGDDWQESRYFSEKLVELYHRRPSGSLGTILIADREFELWAMAKKAIDASLELADELEAA